MAKTSRDAVRHVKALADFFGGIETASREAVEELIRHHKKNKHFKQSLKRLITNGIIEEKKNSFSATPKGILFFLRKRPKWEPKKKWDRKWRLVSFDVPVYDDSKRKFLRSLLKEFDFYQLHKSVWVCPNHLAEHFWKLAVHYDLEKYCKVMLVEIMEGDAELKKHFRLV
ncbi:MAG: hypothetical protein Q8P88_01100 [Candidatus Jorgensenbacteria bacterium]|nr:hypothetical protein [Candidatus Jorgensenbacteria bacterium]